MDNIGGQINFNDFFTKPSLDIKPKTLVDFINSMGTAQYTQIEDVISKTVECGKYDISDEVIGRITNSVSIWLLRIGGEYKKYLDGLLTNG